MHSNIKSQKSKVKSQTINLKFKRRFFVYFLFFIFCSINSQAQCAMCRASLESEGNAKKAEAVNDGIVYLMAIPYLLFVVVAFVVYKMYSKKKA